MQKYLVMSIFCCTFALAFGKEVTQIKLRAFSSAGLEHLPYKQRVGGSNPSTPTRDWLLSSQSFFYLHLTSFRLRLIYPQRRDLFIRISVAPHRGEQQKIQLYHTRFCRGFASNKIGMFLLQILNETD